MRLMSELDKWESDSKKATSGLGLTLLAVITYAGKKILEEMKKQSSDGAYNGQKRAETEQNLKREQERNWISKKFHKKDLEEAQTEYKKYHS